MSPFRCISFVQPGPAGHAWANSPKRGLAEACRPVRAWGRGLSLAWVLAVFAAALSPAWAQTPAPTPAPSGAAAASVGQVEFLRGVGFAQVPGQAPRTLGRGQNLLEGDRITTAEGGTAILRLSDGTRMTVRPGSELVLQQVRYTEGAPDNSLVLNMLRGGLRAITGLIAKGSPDAARLQTATATIGIRGTDFDARLCSGNGCSGESTQVPQSPRPNAVLASAKLVSVQGGLRATSAAGESRRLVAGGSVYPGDLLETDSGSQAVLAFRDDSRLTLGANTRFRVEQFVFDKANPAEGRFLVSLLRGSVRALTGLIGQANTRNVGFVTPTATIGIRGTGLDMDCSDEACSLFAWLGSIEVTPNGQTALQVLLTGQGLFIDRSGVRVIDSTPLLNLPRPDGITVDIDQLFGSADVPDAAQGLFIFVRDGHLEVVQASGALLQLGRGEAGFAGTDGRVVRPALLPLFLEFDRLPLPDSPNPLLSLVFREAGIRPANVCR